jgi:hypothetical protein
MRRKAPVTFGEGRLEKGRASDTTWKTQEGLSTNGTSLAAYSISNAHRNG